MCTEKHQLGSYTILSVKYYVSGMYNCIQSLLQTIFWFTYYVLCLLSRNVFADPESSFTVFEKHKYFMSSFRSSCILHTSMHSLTSIHIRFMCTDVCHAQKLQNMSYTFDQIGYAINKSTYWRCISR